MNNENCNTWHQHDHGYFCGCAECVEKIMNKIVNTSAVRNWRVSFVSGSYVDVRAVSFQILPISQVIVFIDEKGNTTLQVPIKFVPVITQL